MTWVIRAEGEDFPSGWAYLQRLDFSLGAENPQGQYTSLLSDAMHFDSQMAAADFVNNDDLPEDIGVPYEV